jgi:hypothetical protein
MALTIPVIPDLPAGHIATAAEMNQLASAATFLLGKPLVRVFDGTGGYSIASPMLCWDTKSYDTDAMWSSVNKDRLTVQTPGWYKFWCGITTNGAASSVEFFMRSTTGSNNPLGSGINSTSNWEAATVSTSSSPFSAIRVSGIWPYYMYSGDYLTVRGIQTGAASNTYITGVPASFFAMEWVSA